MSELWVGLWWLLALPLALVGLPLLAFLIVKAGTLGYLRARQCFDDYRKKETPHGST